jgi:hypothetical protein
MMPFLWKSAVFGVFLLIALVVVLLEPSKLGDPIPLTLTIVGGGVGAVLGCLAAAEVAGLSGLLGGGRTLLVMAGMVLTGLIAGVALTEPVAIRAAFIGVSPEARMTDLEVVGSYRTSKRQWKSPMRYSLTLRLSDADERLSVDVTQALYDEVGPQPASGEHCIRLPVETGRLGLRRVLTRGASEPRLDLSFHRRCRGITLQGD